MLSKLRWAKSSLSEMQRHDVYMVLRLHRELDVEYLRHWARDLGISDELEDLLREAWTDDTEQR